MTVLAGALTYLAVMVGIVILVMVVGLILEETLGLGAIAVILGWIVGIGNQIFGIIVAAFWIFAMFQGHNPLEAFSYQMWS